jgi:hypothetical protein
MYSARNFFKQGLVQGKRIVSKSFSGIIKSGNSPLAWQRAMLLSLGFAAYSNINKNLIIR